MKQRLFPNIQRLTTAFCISILCVTLSVLGLRLTVFSDMAAAPEKTVSNVKASEDEGYQINSKVYFSSATSKGDLFITNLSAENLININIVLADNGKSVLTTGFINPGASVNSSRMNPFGQKLEDGQYECIAEVSAYDPEDVKTVIGASRMELVLYIGEKPEKN